MTTKDIVYNGNTLPIRRFKLQWMLPNPSIVMIAKRGSGKSWVSRAILKHFSDIPGGVVISPTDKMSVFYGDFIPGSYIHYEYKSEIIEELLYRQEEIIEKAKKKKLEGKKLDPRAFLIMDDCLSSKGSWANDKPIMQVFMDGRHYKLMYILTMQFPLGIKPELRTNFDYIFLLADDMYSNQKRIYEHYAGVFPSFEAFRQVFTQLTDNFGCMVIVNRGANRGLLDKIFWFKADNIDIDKIGCSQFKEFHNNNYNEDWRKRNAKGIDINKIMETKKTTKKQINVEKMN